MPVQSVILIRSRKLDGAPIMSLMPPTPVGPMTPVVLVSTPVMERRKLRTSL